MPRSDDQIREYLAEMEERYNRLVWYAMYDADLVTRSPQGRRRARSVESELTDEVKRLKGPSGQITHAFHCGCLAMARLATGLLSGSDCAPYEFPSTVAWFQSDEDGHH